MSTNKYIISMDTIKTVCQGALGAMTFGAYHQYTTNKIMDLNNEKQEIQYKYFIDKIETQHNKEMTELKDKLKELEQKRRWW